MTATAAEIRDKWRLNLPWKGDPIHVDSDTYINWRVAEIDRDYTSYDLLEIGDTGGEVSIISYLFIGYSWLQRDKNLIPVEAWALCWYPEPGKPFGERTEDDVWDAIKWFHQTAEGQAETWANERNSQ